MEKNKNYSYLKNVLKFQNPKYLRENTYNFFESKNIWTDKKI